LQLRKCGVRTSWARILGGFVSPREVVKVLRLRWYVVAVVLLATALGGLQVKHAQPMYQGTSIIVLAPPKEVTAPNKLAAVTPSLAVAGVAVNTSLLDPSQAGQLRQDGVTGNYTITPRNSGTDETPQFNVPSELITVETGDPTTALRGVTVLQTLYARQLVTWQTDQNIDPSIWITAQVLDPPAVQEVLGAHTRGLIGTALLGLGAAFVLPLWLDRYLRSRNRRLRPVRRTRGASGPRIPRLLTRRAARSSSEG
jgi:hypothetical protein